jgi:N-formylglutamate amidohydrolase
MRLWKLYVVIGLVILSIFLIGTLVSRQCINVNGCEACWHLTPTQITSDLCPNQTCVAEPYKEQHNALVDVILCACAKAKTTQYSDTVLNANIERVYREITGFDSDAQSICSDFSALTKWRY